MLIRIKITYPFFEKKKYKNTGNGRGYVSRDFQFKFSVDPSLVVWN